MIEKAKGKILENYKENKNVTHEPYLKFLELKKIISKDELKFLKIVRSTFSHNQFPPKETIKQFVDINDTKTIAEQIFTIYDAKNQELLEEINKL